MDTLANTSLAHDYGDVAMNPFTFTTSLLQISLDPMMKLRRPCSPDPNVWFAVN